MRDNIDELIDSRIEQAYETKPDVEFLIKNIQTSTAYRMVK